MQETNGNNVVRVTQEYFKTTHEIIVGQAITITKVLNELEALKRKHDQTVGLLQSTEAHLAQVLAGLAGTGAASNVAGGGAV